MALNTAFRTLAGAVMGGAIAFFGNSSAVTAAQDSVALYGVGVPYIVRADYGGAVNDRLRDIRSLRTTKRPIKIQGSVCFSSCTMLLGLERTCVNPNTVFGFHGPSRRGVPLERATFDHASRLIAAHYPGVLKTWYLSVARHSLSELLLLKGSDLIQLGVSKPCDAGAGYANVRRRADPRDQEPT
ncbi:hypothetical protein TRM7557_03118 [Tritonibacter multivorans]|uniref:Uncharacterized protein n=1 Tax=Tritonibacter multivorans TaxID=928856 RepID=A0A0P1H056_9RHOB|nr:hypothetical protein [Tritonibacter multivorans]MDA7422752.1 hypothetical protein [Tritonibacter multivorans]CUH80878.1 hypothetical protein TRM7557_03118 [Tritonibacter multivorans]SFD57117.1 hypothetical protein SAMN04488049_11666 [Tritonibacter multivorans]